MVGGGTDDVTVIDTSTHEVVARVPVGDEPMLAALSPDGRRLLVTNRDSQDVSVVDVETLEPIRRVELQDGPAGCGFSPDGSRAFVANEYAHTVSVLDTASWEVIRHVDVGHGPCDLLVLPGGDVVVTNEESHDTSILDGTTGERRAAVATPDGPLGLAASPDGRLVLVTCFVSNHVYALETSTWTIAWVTRVGTGHVGACFVGGDRFLVSNSHEDHLSLVDLGTREELGRVRVGQNPATLRPVPGTSLVYVANRGGDSASVVDADAMRVVQTVSVGSSPLGVCVG